MVDAGRALSRYDARPWASSLGVPAPSLITTADRLVRPIKQRALAAELGATVRELARDHLCSTSHPAEYAAVTAELVDHVAQIALVASRAGQPAGATSTSVSL
jgi:hypothetical protein